MTWAALLLATAVLLGGGTTRTRMQRGSQPPEPMRLPTPQRGDPLAVASALDVLAACLRPGMAVSTAAAATAASAPPDLARLLTRAADLLALGADPSTAWSKRDVHQDKNGHADALVRLARRSASSGTALADGVTELARQSRGDATDDARAAAERASVLIAGPLGLCFLPAFLCLGIVPVVVGLAGDVLQSGVL